MKAIDPIKLADVIAEFHSNANGAAGIMRAELKANPRLHEIYWFVQQMEEEAILSLLDQLPERAKGCWHPPREKFKETLNFINGLGYSTGQAGTVPSEVVGILTHFMSKEAEWIRGTLADTKVSTAIFTESDLALHHKVPVPIIGDSRFGKTKSVSVWAKMRPGLARIVTVPPSTRDFDFFAAHADAFGIDYTDRTPAPRLKRQVEHVLMHSGLFIIYDEAHFLIPTNYHKDTPPKRINWVRCHVIDKGIGCAFFATPQSMNQTLEKYAACTKYNFEQWLGRLAPPLVLADFYGREDLMAVAKVHFPKFPEVLLELICARAMRSEGYLKSMEFTARYATALAQSRGHTAPNSQDVEDAMQRMIPGGKATSPKTPGEGHAEGLQAPCTAPTRAVKPGKQPAATAKFTERRLDHTRQTDRDLVSA